MNKSVKSITLIELMVSMIIVATVVLSFYNLEIFSHGQLIDSERRAKVQNDLAYCLEHMTKYVHQANGNRTRKAIQPRATGFRVYIDLMPQQTPSDYTDDSWIDYTLTGHTLKATCTPKNIQSTCPFIPATEILTDKIIAGVAGGAVMPNDVDPYQLPYSGPSSGFYVLVDPLGNFVDVGLVGRYTPTKAPARLTNPQVAIKTRLICNSSSTN